MKLAPNKIQIEIEQPKAGGLDLSSRPTGVEVGKVINMADDVKIVKKGDTVMYKSWGVDIVDHEGKKYYFIDLSTKCLLAII